MRTVAVVLAGGTGSRFGGSLPKQLRSLAGRTIIAHCVAAFSLAPGVDSVLVVTAADVADQVRKEVTGFAKVADLIIGGASRTESTRCAIEWLNGQPSAGADSKILFHDAARPLVDQQTIADCISALDEWQAVGTVVASADTIVEIAGGTIQRTLPRESLARCQTPQGFRLSVISRAYELAAADQEFASVPATDDCGIVLRYLPQIPIRTVTGSERNLKITYPIDIAIAQTLLDAP
ncbi:MAG: 2-C-methyl-D-erythritol 4-phosphate cytidylyltransferase [Streptosporangiaceae bacterium]